MPKSTTSRSASTRQRKRTEKAALALLKVLPAKARREAAAEVCAARQPTATAKRIVELHKRADAVSHVTRGRRRVDLSDVQELRVLVLRRDGVLDYPHRLLLARMDRLVAEGSMAWTAFEKYAAALQGMPLVDRRIAMP